MNSKRIYPLPSCDAFIELIDLMGSEQTVLHSARISTGTASTEQGIITEPRDLKLLRYLYTHEHFSTFESVTMTFHIRAPIFVARQWFRHRTWSYNEISGRYTELKHGAYQPVLGELRSQSPLNKQSSGSPLPPEIAEECAVTLGTAYSLAHAAYQSLLQLGLSRETARMVLPLATLTEFRATVNLRNVLEFLRLRGHPSAQYEIRVYAKAITELLQPRFPNVFELFFEKNPKTY